MSKWNWERIYRANVRFYFREISNRVFICWKSKKFIQLLFIALQRRLIKHINSDQTRRFFFYQWNYLAFVYFVLFSSLLICNEIHWMLNKNAYTWEQSIYVYLSHSITNGRVYPQRNALLRQWEQKKATKPKSLMGCVDPRATPIAHNLFIFSLLCNYVCMPTEFCRDRLATAFVILTNLLQLCVFCFWFWFFVLLLMDMTAVGLGWLLCQFGCRLFAFIRIYAHICSYVCDCIFKRHHARRTSIYANHIIRITSMINIKLRQVS